MALQGQLLVAPERLQEQAGTVKTELGEMQGYFEDLERLMSGTAAYWIGEAGDAHRRLYVGKFQKIEEIIRRYREQVTDLEVMAGVYNEAEANAASIADTLPPSTLD